MKTLGLKEFIHYDPTTGVFRWRVSSGKMKSGDIAGSIHSHGYLEISIDGQRRFLHRLAWEYEYGLPPDGQIDHINGDRSDNRISNLRIANQRQNSGNMKKRPNNKSGFKGVSKHKSGKWAAFIHLNYETKYLGLYPTPEMAHEAYVAAATVAFGEFARSR